MRPILIILLSMGILNFLYANKVDNDLGKYAAIIGNNMLVKNQQDKNGLILIRYALCINPDNENAILAQGLIQRGLKPNKIKSKAKIKSFLEILIKRNHELMKKTSDNDALRSLCNLNVKVAEVFLPNSKKVIIQLVKLENAGFDKKLDELLNSEFDLDKLFNKKKSAPKEEKADDGKDATVVPRNDDTKFKSAELITLKRKKKFKLPMDFSRFLKLHYDFEEIKKSELFDATSNHRNGELNNVEIVKGIRGHAGKFNGQSSFIKAKGFDFSPTWTLTFYMKVNSLHNRREHGIYSRNYTIPSKRSNEVWRDHYLYISSYYSSRGRSSSTYIRPVWDNSYYNRRAELNTLDKWQFWAITCNWRNKSSELSIYIDGERVSGINIKKRSYLQNGGELYFGKVHHKNYYLNGYMDDIMFFDKVFNSRTIRKLHSWLKENK
ncbi:MAG: LamG domain-containing protein [Lentisphaeria bacterium]|nr:LamG domain-containing protein [Lentisphaeria bacterium]